MRIDPEFPEKLRRLGAKNVTECFNCGNCTAICPLSDNENMFPRKIVRFIQVGLGDRIRGSPEPWLCHGCGECSVTCPRQAYPSEIMNAARNYTIMEFSTPKFVAKLFESPLYLPVVYLIPLALLYVFFAITGFPTYPEGRIVFSNFIKHTYVEVAGLLTGAYVIGVALVGLWRFKKALGLNGNFFSNLFKGLWLILKHEKFKQCETNGFRYPAHLLVFYGFILLGISTLGALIYLDFLGRELSLPLTDPVKILGNTGALLLITGSLWMIYGRLSNKKAGTPGYSDWFFMITLLLVGVSGLLLELLRISQSLFAYPMYLVHLIFVFTLLVYAPYSKFAHVLYRGLVYVYVEAERG